MPIHEVTLPDGEKGWQWGEHGHRYRSRAAAERQAAAAHAHGYTGDAARAAAGVILRAPDGTILFLKRGANGDHVGEWCFPGGSAEPGEDAEETARRELVEETGFSTDAPLSALDRRFDNDLDFSTFLLDVPEKIVPALNEEHVAFAWAPLNAPPEPLHPGVKATLATDASEKAISERIAREIRRGHDPKRAAAIAYSELGEDAKLAKEAVGYSPGKGESRCRNCVHYLGNRDCEIIAGDIDPDYWCERFERASVGAQDAALVFDRKSTRSYDADGRLHVATTNISKATVNPYYGNEIPDYRALGLDPDKTYQLLRHPDELKKAAPSFNNLQILSRHVPVTADDHQPDLVIGATGSDAEFSAPYLRNSLVIWARDAIDDIESEIKKELSCAYRYRADMTPGTYEGQAYDGVMRDIVGNHVALVREGRAGPDVVVGDSAPPTTTGRTDMTKPVVLTRKAAVAKGALLAFLRPKLAQDQKIDVTPLLATVTAKNFKESKSAIIAGLKEGAKGKLAKDASLDDVTQLLDALEDVEVAEGADIDPNSGLPVVGKGQKEDDTAMDDESLSKIKADLLAFLKGKIGEEDHAKVAAMLGQDEETEEERKRREDEEARKRAEDEEKKDMVTKSAMDAAIADATQKATANALKIAREIRDAERAVRPYVGDLAMAHDSAEGVYATALKALGVKVDGIHSSAFQALLAAQPLPNSKKPAPVAMDAASTKGFADRFPDAARINSI